MKPRKILIALTVLGAAVSVVAACVDDSDPIIARSNMDATTDAIDDAIADTGSDAARSPSDECEDCYDGPCYPGAYPLEAGTLDEEIGWKPADAGRGACTDEELATVLSNPVDGGYFDLANGVSVGCRACIVSKDTDDAWGPIVGTAENGGETGFINIGACFAVAFGAACGKAVQYERFCKNLACYEWCAPVAIPGCEALSLAPTAMCHAFGLETDAACPDDAGTTCATIGDVLRSVCGPIDSGP